MSVTPTHIVVERRGPAVWITLNRPDRLNSITTTMAAELLETFRSLAADHTARVVVLRGSGRGFCAGLDITAVEQGDALAEGMPLPEIILAIRQCPQPVIALVHGAAAASRSRLPPTCGSLETARE
ncbi:enoyl-CoA hydratase/isomerase family protein [Mycobacterium genavense]|uniref:enoyl-CoA hydratase/isomerase family protein n=1 Tax=Mycobacterium genavense TaxID=36812 RepID=UPI0004ACA58B|nr:enoyl-CoA hydratase/isomerase family protein [Mycobacterium genavense]